MCGRSRPSEATYFSGCAPSCLSRKQCKIKSGIAHTMTLRKVIDFHISGRAPARSLEPFESLCSIISSYGTVELFLFDRPMIFSEIIQFRHNPSLTIDGILITRCRLLILPLSAHFRRAARAHSPVLLEQQIKRERVESSCSASIRYQAALASGSRQQHIPDSMAPERSLCAARLLLYGRIRRHEQLGVALNSELRDG